ncbi:PIG-L deacetylase family protein [Tumebacillus permanentifrigoris]|uniref:LmbE family N-acetylglucosaminyl deacetylase n=1 Tax=Tumebacillus permanentifrigoris TaxID=378543 RepID=A0A316DBA9_9BACL|nr:PIG-L family deacetylase [Tumebacillus permanentifrigoris]PWK13906.1 LmbE family N-acetylglucosaminyl deacetylase [Tumebacillus permanentifrigoris]
MQGHKRWFGRLALTWLIGTLLLVPETGTTKPLVPALIDASQVFRQSPPKRLLVIAPHPDDESLAGMAMISSTLSSGGTVRVVVMTNGDGFRGAAVKQYGVNHPSPADMLRLGTLRQQEELQAVERLGLHQQDVTFLGYPDAGLHRLWLKYWNPNQPFQAVNGSTKVPYANAYHPQAPYCGQSVVEDLGEVIREFRPTDVLYPDPHDVHRDHWATSAFTQFALTNYEEKPREWNYLIHYPEFPDPRHYRPDAPLTHPARLQDIGVAWLSLPLNQQVQADKHAAILAHRSQISMMKNLLESFVRTNDLLSTYAVPTIPRQKLTTVELDDRGDQQAPLHPRSTDIREIRAVVQSDSVQIAIQTAEPVRPEDEFQLHLRLPQAPIGKTILEISNQNKQRLTRLHASWSYRGDLAICTLPRSLFQETETVMIGAEIYSRGRRSDSTAWRRFHLSAP